MKKQFFLFIMMVVGLLSLNTSVHALDDVTGTYLQNADFEVNPTGAATENTIYDVEGWVEEPQAGVKEYYKLGTVAYESVTGPFGTAPSNGSSVTSDNNTLLGVKVHWCPGVDIYVEQTAVSLPAGKYRLTWDSYVAQTTANQISRCGYVINETAMYDALPISINTWKNHSLEFVIEAEKDVTIRMGYNKVTDGGGAASAILFVDNVKLFCYDTNDLKAIIADASELYNEEAGGAEALNTAIGVAQEVADKQGVTPLEIGTAIDDLRDAILAYKYANASQNDPIDMTSFIINPSFEANQGDRVQDIPGWTKTGATGSEYSTRNNTEAATAFKVGNVYFQNWGSSNPDYSISQTLSNLPNGKYHLTVVVGGDGDPNSGTFIFAGNEETEVTGTVADTYSVDVIIVDNTLNIGLKSVNRNHKWSYADNFQLYYYGVDITALEEVLTGLKTTAESISGIMQTAVVDELAAAIAYAEEVLAAPAEYTLNAATSRLTNAIAEANTSIQAYATLLATIATVSTYKDAHTDLDGIDDFTAAIAVAQAVYDTHEADNSAVAAAATAVSDAMRAFISENAIDLTGKIVDAAVTSTNAWTGGRINSGEQYTGAPDNTYLDYYNMEYDGYQVISGLPDGEYILTAAVRAGELGIGSLYASSGDNEYLHPVIGVGSTGNVLGNGWYRAEIIGIIVSDGTLRIGIKGESRTNKWIGADDFHLYCIGASTWLGASVEGLAFDNVQTEITFNLEAINIYGDVQITTNISGLTVPSTVAVSGETTSVTATYEGTNFDNVSGTITIAYSDEHTIELPVKIVSETFEPNEGNLIPGNGYMNSFSGFAGGWGTKSIISVLGDEAEEIYSGIACAKITGASVGYPNGGSIDITIGWQPNTLYRLRAMVKTIDGDFNIGAGQTYVDGVEAKNFKIAHTDGEWVQIDTTFLTGAAATEGLLYFNNDGNAGATGLVAYIDNYELFIVDPAPYIEALQTAKNTASAKYNAIDPASVAGEEEGEVDGKYTYAAYTALSEAITAAEAILANPEASNIVEIIAATEALTTAIDACVIYIYTDINSFAGENRITVFASDKAIEIRSTLPLKAAVYTSTGLLVKGINVNGTQTVPVDAGLYIVKAGANIVKVIVK